ncbi:MAG: hypothetical protein D6687_04515 [Acidobacteria bacterium]|jgi:hypothetical protein|nr:MAG: hypothetical protein D6687_04515 [Acidobacteriota bacterium]
MKFLCLLIFSLSITAFAENRDLQSILRDYSRSQELSEDGIPVIIKNLPDWEKVKDEALLIKNKDELIAVLGERPVFEAIDFIAGTEAAVANYQEGKLLLIEYNTPQLSIEADEKIKAKLSEAPNDPTVLYKRIGNYNAFVFDITDTKGAEILLGKIKYAKVVKWLSEDPFLYEKIQRSYYITAGQIIVSSIMAVVLGIGISAVLGVFTGILIFQVRQRQRKSWTHFSDAGGMLRLNLDDLQEVPKKPLLKG